MRFYRDKFGMGGLLVGTVVTLLLLFLQNSGGLTLENPVLSVLWWILAWPFTLTAVFVAFTAMGANMSPSWGVPLLLFSMVVNVVYFYGLGRLVGFVKGRIR